MGDQVRVLVGLGECPDEGLGECPDKEDDEV